MASLPYLGTMFGPPSCSRFVCRKACVYRCFTDFGCVAGGATSSEGSARGAQKLLTRGHLPLSPDTFGCLCVHLGLTWAAFQALGDTETEVGLSSSNPHQPWRRDPSLKEAPDFASEFRMCLDMFGCCSPIQKMCFKLAVSYSRCG